MSKQRIKGFIKNSMIQKRRRNRLKANVSKYRENYFPMTNSMRTTKRLKE